MGANGAVIKSKFLRGSIKGRIFALKAVFNMGLSNEGHAAFDQYRCEFLILSRLPRHKNVMVFYAQFVAPVPPALLPHLPEFVREAATINPMNGRRRTRPLPNQWVVFEWLPQTLQGWSRTQYDEGGEDMTEMPWPKVAKVMRDVCLALVHLDDNHVVRLSTLIDVLSRDVEC